MATEEKRAAPLSFDSDDLWLSAELRCLLRADLATLRKLYVERGWAGRVDPGERAALIDLSLKWTDPANHSKGANVDAADVTPLDSVLSYRGGLGSRYAHTV